MKQETLAAFDIGICVAGLEDPHSRDPWPAWWLESADSLIAERCRQFWISVLYANLIDSLKAADCVSRGQRTNQLGYVAGPHWWESEAMCEVASLAGFHGPQLRERLAAAVDRDGFRVVIKRMTKNTANSKYRDV